MDRKYPLTRAVVTVVATTLLLLACSGEKPENLLASAKVFMGKNDFKAASIQIKNALQSDPNLAEARYLLGMSLWAMGDVVGAESELRKAMELKFSRDLVVPPLARAMVALGQGKKLAEEFGKVDLGTAAARADLQTSLAVAYGILGKADAADAALVAALKAEPGYAPAMLAQARRKLTQRDVDGAIAIVDEVLVKKPNSAEAWKLKGDLLFHGKGQNDDAIAAFRKAIEVKPEFLSAHASVAQILLMQGKLPLASTQVDAIKKFAGNHPQTKFLSAQLAYMEKNFKLARDLVLQVLKVAPDNSRALNLAGAIELQLNSLVQAEAYLSKAVQKEPELALARRMLITTYLRMGQSAKALAILQPSLAKESFDPELPSLAGEVYLQNGDLKRAEEYFSKAAKADPKDPRRRTSLALVHLVGGNTDFAFGELQDIAASDPSPTADLAMISAHLRRNEYDKALKAIDGLERKQPGKPFAANLRGRTYQARNDLVAARKSFEAALVIEPTFFPAVASLASIDLLDKKPADAKKRFEAVLTVDPKNAPALLALATLAARTAAPKEEVVTLLGKAIAANPTEVAPRVLLIDFYLNEKDFKQASSAAQSAVAAVPDSPELLDALGRTQQRAGEYNQAITSYNKLAAMQPRSPQPLLRIADVQMSAKNSEGAAQSLRRSLEIKPDLLDAQRGLIMLSLEAKKYREAVAIAKDVQKQRPKEAVGYLLEGDISAAQKNWDTAMSAYREGLKVVSAPELALKLHAALTSSGKAAEADKFAAAWARDNPKDATLSFYLGDAAIVQKDLNAAERHYLAVVKAQPGNAAAYNNLAWVAGSLRKDGAIGYAEKANQLVPNQPAFMDTLAMLLSEKGEHARAMELQSKVVALQGNNPLFRLNLAKIYIKGGNKDLAKKELDDLAKLGDKFSSQAEVAKLKSGL